MPLWAPFAVAFARFVLAGVAFAVIVARRRARGAARPRRRRAPGVTIGATFVQDLAADRLGAAARALARPARRPGAVRAAPHPRSAPAARLGAARRGSSLAFSIGWSSRSASDGAGRPHRRRSATRTAALALAGYIGVLPARADRRGAVLPRLLFPALRARARHAAGVRPDRRALRRSSTSAAPESSSSCRSSSAPALPALRLHRTRCSRASCCTRSTTRSRSA